MALNGIFMAWQEVSPMMNFQRKRNGDASIRIRWWKNSPVPKVIIPHLLAFVDHMSCSAETYVSLVGSYGCADGIKTSL